MLISEKNVKLKSYIDDCPRVDLNLQPQGEYRLKPKKSFISLEFNKNNRYGISKILQTKVSSSADILQKNLGLY